MRSALDQHLHKLRALGLFSLALVVSFALSWQLVFSAISLSPYKDKDGQLVVVLCHGGYLINTTGESDPSGPLKKGPSGNLKACPFAVAGLVDVILPFVLTELSGTETAISDIDTDAKAWNSATLNTNQPRAPPRLE